MQRACLLVFVTPVYSAMITFPEVHFKHFIELTATDIPHSCVQVRPTLLCLTYRITYKLNKTTWVSESQQGWHQFPSFPWGVSQAPHSLHPFLLFYLLCFIPQKKTALLIQLPTPILRTVPSICQHRKFCSPSFLILYLKRASWGAINNWWILGIGRVIFLWRRRH